MTSKLLIAIPNLPVLNIEESIDFYQNKMGFSIFNHGNYVTMDKDDIELHLWLCDDKYLCEMSSCYIRVENIESLYEEYKAKDIIHPNGHLENKPWQMKEFVVLDNNGNGIRFGEKIK